MLQDWSNSHISGYYEATSQQPVSRAGSTFKKIHLPRAVSYKVRDYSWFSLGKNPVCKASVSSWVRWESQMRVMGHHLWQRNSCSDTTRHEIAKLLILYISLQKGSATMWWPFVSKYRADPRFDATFMDVALCPAILAESKLSEFFI